MQPRPAIIGAGPIGLEVAWALKREGLDPIHIDAGPIGATLNWWAPGTRFFSSPERIAICGVPLLTPNQDKATREEYLQYLRAVASQFDLKVRTFERVTKIESESASAERWFRVHTLALGYAQTYGASHVIVAMGDMHKPRLLGIPGEDQPHVSHYFQDPHRYFGRRVLIVGGKNSAVEAAIRCYRAGAASVTISYRKGEFNERHVKYWLLPELKGLIKSGHIGFLPFTVPISIEGPTVRLAKVDDEGQATETTHEFQSDDVLMLVGYEMDGGLLAAAGVTMHGLQNAPTFNPKTMETNVPGLYVAGTATAGTQARFRVFIENCHSHGPKIAAHLMGRTAPEPIEERVEGALET